MMDDTYFEDSVSREPIALQKIFGYFFLAFGIILIVLGFFTLPLGGGYLWVVAIILFVVFYFFNRSLILDFDYCYAGDTLEIAKVTGKARRKRLVYVDFKENLYVMAPIDSEELAPYIQKRFKTFDCTGSDTSLPVYCFAGKNTSKAGEEVFVYFQPNPAMLKAMHRTKPREIKVAREAIAQK